MKMRRPSRLLFALLLLPATLAAQGRVVVDTLHSEALRGNRIGDATDRTVYVYLPSSYDHAPHRRYPVLYLLHGMTSHPSEWLDGSYQGFDLARAMDSLALSGAAEFLVVMPHADNAYGGTFYVDSPAFGGWERFVVQELVPFVDGRYRTRPERLARGVAGQSMGGFGALYLAGRHPETFGSVYALSPCCLGFVGELAAGVATWGLANAPDSLVPAAMRGRVRIVRAMAAAFAPGPQLHPTGRSETPVEGPLPFRPNGSEDPATRQAWRGYLPLERFADDLPSYRRLAAIALDFGRADAIESVPIGSRALAAALRRAGIAPLLVEHDGGHVDRARERFEQGLLPFFTRVFATAPRREADR
jgi:S-formylglutathione hydrolase